jgi:hypothetical protein
MSGTGHVEQPLRYEIYLRGHLGKTMRAAFPAFQSQLRRHDTVLAGELPDHTALYGVLAQIETLGLELLALRRLPP